LQRITTDFQSCALKLDKLKKPADVFFEMVDLDKGVLGREYNISLFLHVSIFSLDSLAGFEPGSSARVAVAMT
jgi:hypothetical protein